MVWNSTTGSWQSFQAVNKPLPLDKNQLLLIVGPFSEGLCVNCVPLQRYCSAERSCTVVEKTESCPIKWIHSLLHRGLTYQIRTIQYDKSRRKMLFAFVWCEKWVNQWIVLTVCWSSWYRTGMYVLHAMLCWWHCIPDSSMVESRWHFEFRDM
jgi:hypothetical protein